MAGAVVRPAVPTAATSGGPSAAASPARSRGSSAAGASRLAKSVETCAYYLNPFEWWAYSREDRWPPPGVVERLAWRRPLAAARTPAD